MNSTALARFLQALPSPAKGNGSRWEGRCPAHEDTRASLSIAEGHDGAVLLKCHAGCETAAIVKAVGLSLHDLFRPDEPAEPETVYDYCDEDGTVAFQVCRFPGKQFRQRRPDGAGGWIWKLDNTRRVLYRVRELKGQRAVFLVEGEKDTDRLVSLGLPATTNPGGAGKWRDDYTKQLKAAGVERVCVLPDRDPPGEAHARLVARSCHDAGLVVRVLPLPGLADKADVTDWLVTHTKAELLDAARDCPIFTPAEPAAAGFKASLTSLRDLLSEPDDLVDWIVDDRIPAAGIVLLAGKPKAGKSTLARALAYAVASGESWLGWRTCPGAVWYLNFEDKRGEVRKHFRRLGATGREPLRLFFGQGGPDLLAELQALAASEKPAAIIVDTLQRLIHVKDLNDYAQVTERCAPLLTLARDTGAALVLLHHANKFGEGLDSVLGSSGLAASVDNVFLLGRSERYRTLSSVQRIGPDLDAIVLTLDPDTGRVTAAGSKRDADEADAAGRILAALVEQNAPVTEGWIKAHVEGRLQDVVRGLRLLLRQGRVLRTGRGGKGDPFEYVGTTSTLVCTDSGSQVPVRTREPGNHKESEGGSRGSGLFQNLRNGDTKTRKTAGKTEPDSGSRDLGFSRGAEAVSRTDSGSRDCGWTEDPEADTP